MSSTIPRCLHLHSMTTTTTTRCRHSLLASAASYLSASSSGSGVIPGSSMSMSMLASSSLSPVVDQGRMRVAGLGAGARTRRLRMAMFHSTPVGMYSTRNKKPSSKSKPSKKSSKLASISSVKGSRNRSYPGKADAPKEGTNILDIEQRRASGGGGGRRDDVDPSEMSYKSRSRMYARENEKKQRDQGERRKSGKAQREASRESDTQRASKYFDEPPSPPSKLSSPSTSSKPRVTAVLDSTAKALGSGGSSSSLPSSSKSSSSSFARDEAPHRNLAAAVQTHTRWGDIPRDSRPPPRSVRGVGLRRRGWDAAGAGRAEGKDAGRYNERPLFDPEGTFRGTEEIFFDRSPSLGNTHRKQADGSSNAHAPDAVSTAIRDALARSEDRMAGTPLPERMPFRHKVQIERQVLRAMDTAGSGSNGNGNNGYDNDSAVYAYRQRKGNDDLGFVLGELEDAKRRRGGANDASGSWVGYDRSRGRVRGEEEDEGGVYEDGGENEIVIEGIDESLERGHDGGEFYRPTKLVQPVGESGVDLPGSLSSRRGSKETTGKASKKDAVDLQRFIDKELQDTPQNFDQARLLDGFKKALGEMFGRSTSSSSSKTLAANEGPSRGAKPTPIQALSLRWIVGPQLTDNKLEGRSEEVEAEEDAHASGTSNDLLVPANQAPPATQTTIQKWRQYLLAAETGSGKSIAYLLPVLQSLKLSESAFQARQRWELQRAKSFAMAAAKKKGKKGTKGKAEREEGEDEEMTLKKKIYEHNPRALILAPTHELARQLASFAKDLVHQPDTKLRVICASRENVDAAANTRRDERSGGRGATSTAGSLGREVVFDNEHEFETMSAQGGDVDGPGERHSASHKRKDVGMAGNNPVDVLVGTPMKILEMVYGRGWDRVEEHEQNPDQREMEEENGELDEDGKPKKLRRGRDKMVHFGTWKHRSELGLENIEWVVVDEADVLFDPDFEATTRQLLESIATARAASLPSLPAITSSEIESSATSPTTPTDYPFNLLLTSATIPTPLNTYLEKNHPRMLRLASPRLHKLPKTVQTEYVGWTGGNKFADVLRRARKVWAEDWGRRGMNDGDEMPLKGQAEEEEERLSKILVFCNKSSKVLEMSKYFEEQGVPNVPVTSKSEHRGRGSNRHLEGFLREKTHKKQRSSKKPDDTEGQREGATTGGKEQKPRVLITTSLLSRGLDFSPSIKHVFIIDEPRNMIDFLHRAGRVGRAGERGTVVLFGKLKGRGSLRGKEVRRRVGGMI